MSMDEQKNKSLQLLIRNGLDSEYAVESSSIQNTSARVDPETVSQSEGILELSTSRREDCPSLSNSEFADYSSSSPLTNVSQEETSTNIEFQTLSVSVAHADSHDSLKNSLQTNEKCNAVSSSLSSSAQVLPGTSQSSKSVRLVDARLRRSGNQMIRHSSTYSYKTRRLTKRRNKRRSSSRIVYELFEYVEDSDMVFRLSDLPVELTLEIMEYCDFDSLYALTATSQSMRDLAFPFFRATSSLSLPGSYPIFGDSYGAVDVMTPEHALVLCVWRRHQTFHRIGILNFMLEQEADRTALLVNRILCLFESFSPMQQPFVRMINIYISSFRDISAEASRLVYGLQDAKCVRLSITGFTRISDFSSAASSALPLMEPTATGYEGLESFHGCGSFHFLPHMLPFTMNNLLSSNLRELVLNMNDFCTLQWSRILRSLTFPNLVILNFGGSLTISASLRFLGRHSKLQNLALSGIATAYVQPNMPKGFSLIFPDLVCVRAPSLYLGDILKYTRHPSNITTLEILTDFYQPLSSSLRGTFSRTSMVKLLEQVQKFPSVTKMQFHFSRSGSVDFCDTSRGSEAQPPEVFLSSLETIAFHKTLGVPFNKHALERLVDWCALFPHLAFVELWENSSEDRSEWISALRSKGFTPYHIN